MLDLAELKTALSQMKNSIAPNLDGINSDLLMYGRILLRLRQTNAIYVSKCNTEEMLNMPQMGKRMWINQGHDGKIWNKQQNYELQTMILYNVQYCILE